MQNKNEKKQGKGAKTQKKILRAARTVFSNHPYHVASIRMVGKEGGFDHPLISYYFPSKEKLFEAAIVEMIDECDQYQENLYDGLHALSIEDGVSLFVDRIVEFHLDNPELLQMIMQNTINVGKSDSIPGIHLIIDFLSNFIENLQKNIPVKASADEVSKLVYNFAVVIINYLGAESFYTSLIGIGTDKQKYQDWVKDTLKLLFQPLIRKMILPRGQTK